MPNISANRPSRAAVIVAAGRGERAGGGVPKQYRGLAGRPLLQRTYDALSRSGFDAIVIVIAETDDAIGGLDIGDTILTTGGATRSESVRNGLKALESFKPDHVYIHDAARPFVSRDMIARLGVALSKTQATAPALRIPDALKRVEGSSVIGEADRDSLRRVQTPQAFHYIPLLKAYEELEGSHDDDIAVAVAAGMSTQLVEGDEENFKITYCEDFEKAERHISRNRGFRIGQGYDVHRIGDGDGVWIGGVFIECGFSLIGHSDADVGLHAVTDALLGACAKGDIGDHFPPSDPQWKGVSSDRFLKHAVDLCDGTIENIDLTIVCERPKIKPHREAIRRRIADICELEVSQISLKATTTEGLGFEGREEGISAQAVVLVSS